MIFSTSSRFAAITLLGCTCGGQHLSAIVKVRCFCFHKRRLTFIVSVLKVNVRGSHQDLELADVMLLSSSDKSCLAVIVLRIDISACLDQQIRYGRRDRFNQCCLATVVANLETDVIIYEFLNGIFVKREKGRVAKPALRINICASIHKQLYDAIPMNLFLWNFGAPSSHLHNAEPRISSRATKKSSLTPTILSIHVGPTSKQQID